MNMILKLTGWFKLKPKTKDTERGKRVVSEFVYFGDWHREIYRNG